MALRGSSETQLDEKNRIRIPAKFVEVFREEYKGEKLYFVIYVEGRLSLMAESVLNARLEPFENIPPDDREAMDSYSKISETIEIAAVDGQGRVTIPKNLRDSVEIKKDVITIGLGSYLEIWAKEVREQSVGDMTIRQAIATASASARANSK